VTREDVRALMQDLAKKNGGTVTDDAQELRTIPFRSIDFSELALHVEESLGFEITFDAAKLREITTVGDVLNFFDEVRAEAA
jgi:acyl carrier protein